ncbi:MAG: hypothetical protein XD95_0641 [Microgenomates bacterium 39_7]|nr:MAG: hypothetical protein XD95_0641 [Microgenomates bacterium 39_7]
MKSSSTLKLYLSLQQNNIKLFDYQLLKKLSGIKNNNSLYKFASRMQEAGLIKSLNKAGKFALTDALINEFEIANFLYEPSYISLESALSHYGILSQFVYTITSLSTKQTRKLVLDGKEYSYSSINKDLFWGYTKSNNYLIALPEKALLDSLYFVSKGIINLDINNLDLSDIDLKKLQLFLRKFDNNAVEHLFNKLKI